jgi:anti-sigma regulatory factor (Ser/Thr protein kinase)
LRFLPEAQAARVARQQVRELAMRMGVAEPICDAAALVVDELVNNAIEHGVSYRKSNAHLSIGVAFESGRLSVEFVDPEMPEPTVRDLADALQAAANGMPSLDSERGRGLFLISIYMEEVRVDVAPGGGMRLLGRMSQA